jgi:hypothetical protein
MELKFSCGDIGSIYRRDIESKIGDLLTNKRKLKEAKEIFSDLGVGDRSMLQFIDDQMLGKIDAFQEEAEKYVDVNDLNRAEDSRLRFKKETGDIMQHLECFNGAMSDLVMKFAQIGKVPVTLSKGE